jgi:hypothetical protein
MAKGSKRVAALSGAEFVAFLRPMITLYKSPKNPFKSVPVQFRQPAEAVAAYDGFKALHEVAHPSDSKQTVDALNAQRQVANEVLGDVVDMIELAARKDPGLPALFGIDSLGQTKAKTVNKMAVLLAAPLLLLQALDKELGSVHCKVRGGVSKGIEIFLTYDDPSNEANWHLLETFVNGAFVIPGLISGRRAFLRGRYIYSKGKKGPWSAIVNIMVP